MKHITSIVLMVLLIVFFLSGCNKNDIIHLPDNEYNFETYNGINGIKNIEQLANNNVYPACLSYKFTYETDGGDILGYISVPIDCIRSKTPCKVMIYNRGGNNLGKIGALQDNDTAEICTEINRIVIASQYRGFNGESSEEEIVCNALMSIPSEEKAMEVINDMEQDEKRSLLSALKKFIQKIKAFLSEYAKTTAETKAYIGDVENITKLAEMVKNSIIDTDRKSEQGRNTRLDIDGKDVVFAESGVSYFSKIKKSSKEDQPTIKEQIKTHLTQLNNMKPVANISSKGRDNRNYSKIKEDILAEYKKIGNVVDRQNFGFIELSKKEVSISLSYLKSDAEIATFAAVPKVLKRGIEIDHHKSHKDRGYDSWTFAAPVIINGKKGFVGVVVRKTGQYRYKTHRIVATDGTEFVLIKENAEARNLGVTTKKNDSKGSNITTAFNETIPQNNTDVKYSLNDVIDNEYLEAVKNNDIEIAQKLVDEAAKENGYTIKAYHGTTNQHGKSTWNEKTKSYDTEYKRFTVFKKQYDEQAGHFFNDDIDNAGGYGSFLYSGVSRGGMMTYICASKDSRIKRIIGISAPADLALCYNEREDMAKLLNNIIGGSPDAFPDRYKKRSALCWSEKLTVPTLIIHSRQDKQVSFEQAEQLAKEIENNNPNNLFKAYDDDIHGIHEEDIGIIKSWLNDSSK